MQASRQPVNVVLALALSGLLACSGSSVQVAGGTGGRSSSCVGEACKRSSGAGGTSTANASSTRASSSSGGTSTSTASGASTGGSSGAADGGDAGCGGLSNTGDADAGSTAAFSCPNVPGYDGSGDALCGDGGWYSGRFYNLATCALLGGATLQAIAADGVPISGAGTVSDPCGGFLFCVPGLAPLTVSFSLAGYPPSYLGETLGTQQLGQNALISTGTEDALAAFATGGIEAKLGVLTVNLYSDSSCLISGWSVALSYADGGPVPDGGAQLVYLASNDFPDPSLTSTSALGTAIFYNIDTSAQSYFRVDLIDLDGGCVAPGLAAGVTGRFFVTGGGVTYDYVGL